MARNGHSTSRMGGAVLIALLLASSAAPVFASAGRISFAYGRTTVVSADGALRRAVRGASLESGETIRTGSASRAQLIFTDGGRVSLLPRSEFRIDEYRYRADAGKKAEEEAAESEERGFFSLLKGGLRTITGAIGKLVRKNYQLATPNATIGIRGTEFLVLIVGQTVRVSVAPTSVDGIFVTTGAGPLTVLPGQSAVCGDSAGPCTLVVTSSIESAGVPTLAQFVSAEEVNDDGSAQVVPQAGPCTGTAECMVFSYGAASGTGIGTLGLNSKTLAVGGGGPDRPDLTSFSPAAGGTVTIGSTTSGQQGIDGPLAWGRWRPSGTTGGAGGPAPFPLTLTGPGSSNGMHYVVGTPTADMPTAGRATYDLVCSPKCATDGKFVLTGTSNTMTGGGGDIRSGKLVADFASRRVAADLQTENKGYVYTITTSGGLANPAASQLAITHNTFANASTLLATGGIKSGEEPQCPSGCETAINGFFAGTAASHAGLVYNIKTAPTSPSAENLGNVLGGAAFKQ